MKLCEAVEAAIHRGFFLWVPRIFYIKSYACVVEFLLFSSSSGSVFNMIFDVVPVVIPCARSAAWSSGIRTISFRVPDCGHRRWPNALCRWLSAPVPCNPANLCRLPNAPAPFILALEPLCHHTCTYALSCISDLCCFAGRYCPPESVFVGSVYRAPALSLPSPFSIWELNCFLFFGYLLHQAVISNGEKWCSLWSQL